jgi:menaquinone-dependent protoporphyrinogen oxidase
MKTEQVCYVFIWFRRRVPRSGCRAGPLDSRAFGVPRYVRRGTPSTTYVGGAAVGKRVLVGYATGKGSTVGVAEAIGKTLGERGFSVDVKPMDGRPPVEGYDAVVLGSAVNGGKWLPEAISFAEANKRALGKVPVAVFCVHAMNFGDEPKPTKRRLAYLNDVRALVTPCAEGFFGGVAPLGEDTSFILRAAFKAFGGEAGDTRDWDAIGAWAEQLPV